MDTWLGWIYNPDTSVPNFNTEDLGHCVDMATLKQLLSLWIVEDRGQPLPPAKHILPTVIAKWNKVKGGIDVYSRYLKTVKARHLHLGPLAAIWMRILITMVYNAYQSMQILQVYGTII
ncbi:hypothetical protein PHMEG_00018266 [Phytophthora megakarya]|uniref:Uncharacterized protein n=1 Tax=Phytophthora megakarya TaxID=4795 RepID=A0A225VUF5_9STRA|nr:hypothetical protein PHMEG_00018266 [Phytophthora megakarya]